MPEPFCTELGSRPSEIYNVITHAGRAHIDEILAIAVLSAWLKSLPSCVERISSEDIISMVASGQVPEATYVIDSGMVYNPTRRLFDHHQDSKLDSAALLMFNYCYPNLADSDLARYLQLVSKVDTRGEQSLDDSDVIGESREYWSFSQRILTMVFERDPSSVVSIVSRGIIKAIEFEDEKNAARNWLSIPDRLKPICIGGVMILEYKEPPPKEISSGLKEITKGLVEEYEAAAIYGYDSSTPEIRTLYRTSIGDSKLNFTQVPSSSEILFVHQGGFLMRFKPSSPERWKKMITQSLLVGEKGFA